MSRAERAEIWSRQEVARASLERVVAIGDRHGIAILPVKGVLSARRYYDDVSERPMQDVDVRVTRRALARLRDVGPREGLVLIHDARAYENLVFDVDGMMVEMEAHVGPPGVCAITVDEMIARAATHTSTFGFACLEPELHDHALVLVVNAFKDKLIDALPWSLEDLKRIVKQPAFDAAEFAALARRGRVTSLAWIVAQWLLQRTSNESDASADERQRWGAVIDALGEPPRRRYAHWMLERLSASTRNRPIFIERNAIRVAARASSDSAAGCAHALGVMAMHGAERALGMGIELK